MFKYLFITLSLFLFFTVCLTAQTNQSDKVSITNEQENLVYTPNKTQIAESNGMIYIRTEADIDSSKTIDEGTKIVIDKAKKEILEYKGAKVTASLFNLKLYDRLNDNSIYQASIQSRAEGYITEFQIITKAKKLVAGGDYTRIIIYAKAKYEKIKGNTDPAFNLTVQLNKRLFITGDQMEITINSSQEGFITVYSFDKDGKAFPLFPNSFNQNNKIRAKSAFMLPTKLEKDASASYHMFLAEGVSDSLEFVRVIVTAEPFSMTGIETIDDFPARFVNMKRNQFEYVDIGYKIVLNK
jgi:hypothetical protein